ncbi:hypothetical protein Taro_033872, partial [Colocasia esculenta]|nr:hypothetical protein [Colocasia esculenta]
MRSDPPRFATRQKSQKTPLVTWRCESFDLCAGSDVPFVPFTCLPTSGSISRPSPSPPPLPPRPAECGGRGHSDVLWLGVAWGNAEHLLEAAMTLLRRAIPSASSYHSVVSCFLRAPGGAVPSRPWSSSSSPTSCAAGRGTLGIHVFRCPDAVGVVAKITECIASHGGNIHGVDVFVPEDKPIFYSRAEFIFDPASWPREIMDVDFSSMKKFFNADRSIVRVPDIDPKFKIAVLASKQDHCLVDVLHGWQDGRLPVHINCVISNHQRAPNTHVMRFLERNGIPYHYLPTIQGNRREEEILDLVQDTNFIVLARYMQKLHNDLYLLMNFQILSGSFLKCYGKDIINIHHGLLPSFKGGNPSRQAYDAGVKLIGATSHFVTEELDEGPIIEQMVERVSHRDSLRSFVQKSENLEKQCLAKAIRSYCELRVLPYEVKKTVVIGGNYTGRFPWSNQSLEAPQNALICCPLQLGRADLAPPPPTAVCCSCSHTRTLSGPSPSSTRNSPSPRRSPLYRATLGSPRTHHKQHLPRPPPH